MARLRLRDRPRAAIAPQPGMRTLTRRLSSKAHLRKAVADQEVTSHVVADASLVPPLDPRGAAFFDLDNTMVRGASMFHYARGLVAHRFMTPRHIVQFAWRQAYFRWQGCERAGHLSAARERGLSLIQGRGVTEFTEHADAIFDDYLADKIWSGTLALARMHRDAGQRVWLVTAAPVEIARTIANHLDLTGALGTECEVRDGVYTGRLVGDVLHGPAKAAAVRELADREGLDLARCAAYSDSSNDVPMLELVGYPCAINPDGALLKHARAAGWRVRDFRRGRRVAIIGVPTAAGVGALAGTVAAGVARRRRRRMTDDATD